MAVFWVGPFHSHSCQWFAVSDSPCPPSVPYITACILSQSYYFVLRLETADSSEILAPIYKTTLATLLEPTDMFLSHSRELSLVVADIRNNLSDVGFGHVTHDTQDLGFLEYSTSITRDCYGWGVPLGAGRQTPAWVAYITEFSSLTWSLILAALFLAAVTLWLLTRLLPQWQHKEKQLWGTPR
jgi:hypothetical protein